MALPSDDDLKYTLMPEVDVGAIEKYLAKVQGLATATGKSAAKSLSTGLSSTGKFDPSGLVHRHELLKQITEQLKEQLRQTDLATKGSAEYAAKHDKLLRQRVELNRQLAALKQPERLDESTGLAQLRKRLDIEQRLAQLSGMPSSEVKSVAQAAPQQPQPIAAPLPPEVAPAPSVVPPEMPPEVPGKSMVLPPEVPTAVVPIAAEVAATKIPPPLVTAQSAAVPIPPAVETTLPPTTRPGSDSERLDVERQIAEAMGEQHKLADSMTDLGVSPELVKRREELERITAELVRQHEQYSEVERGHQNEEDVPDVVAQEATKRRLVLEDAITESKREQAEIEQVMTAAADNSPAEARHRAEVQILDLLAQEEQRLYKLRALNDPKFVERRLELERQLAEVRAQQSVEAEKLAPPPLPPLTRQQKVEQVVTESREQAEKRLGQIEVASDPAAIREAVEQENRLAEAQARYAKAVEDERDLQRGPLEALDARAEVMREVTAELAKQRQELERQRILLDPEIVAKRLGYEKESAEVAHQRELANLRGQLDPEIIEQQVRRERELAELQQRLAAARQAEQAKYGEKQEGQERPSFDLKGVLEATKQGGLGAGLKAAVSALLKGVDIPQLLAGVLGAFKGQGLKGAFGALAGGVVGAGMTLSGPQPVGATPVDVPPQVVVAERERPKEIPRQVEVPSQPVGVPSQPVGVPPQVVVAERERSEEQREREQPAGAAPVEVPPQVVVAEREQHKEQREREQPVEVPSQPVEVPPQVVVAERERPEEQREQEPPKEIPRQVEMPPQVEVSPQVDIQPQVEVPPQVEMPPQVVIAEHKQQKEQHERERQVETPPQIEVPPQVVVAEREQQQQKEQREHKRQVETPPQVEVPPKVVVVEREQQKKQREREQPDEIPPQVVVAEREQQKEQRERERSDEIPRQVAEAITKPQAAAKPKATAERPADIDVGKIAPPKEIPRQVEVPPQVMVAERPVNTDVGKITPPKTAARLPGESLAAPVGPPPQATATKIGSQAAGEVAGAGAAGGAEAAVGAGAGVAAEAAAGPIGLAVVAAQAVAKVAGQLYSVPFKGIGAGLDLVGDSLRGMQGPLGPVGVGFDLVSKGLHGLQASVEKIPLLGDLLEPTLGALAAIPNSLKGILETLSSFSAKASPALFKQLEMALDDSQAVIGHTFLPVLEMLTAGVRLAGSALASFLPDSREMTGALSEVRGVLSTVGDKLREVMGKYGPQVREFLVGIITKLGSLASVLAKHLGGVLESMMDLTMELASAAMTLASAAMTLGEAVSDIIGGGSLDLLTLWLRGMANSIEWLTFMVHNNPLMQIARAIHPPAPGGEPRSDVGAAAKQASFASIEQYQQQLQQSAFSQGGAQTDLPTIANQQLNVLERLEAMLARALPQEGFEGMLRMLLPLPDVGLPALPGGGALGGAVGAGGAASLVALRRLLGI